MPFSITARAGLRGGNLTVALLGLSAVVSSCLAQSPYEAPRQSTSGAAGSAGKSSSGGLSLGGSASEPSSGTTSSGGDDIDPSGSTKCTTSDQCGPPAPYCLVNTGTCVECLASRNCAGSGLGYCDPKSNLCVQCLVNEQCPKLAPYCSTSIGQCVECLSTANCGREDLVCDRINFRCVETCTTNADCVVSPQVPFCDPERNLCSECLVDNDCPAEAPRCDPHAKVCAPCVEDADCSGKTPRCELVKHSCVACLTNGDCQVGATCVAGNCVQPH